MQVASPTIPFLLSRPLVVASSSNGIVTHPQAAAPAEHNMVREKTTRQAFPQRTRGLHERALLPHVCHELCVPVTDSPSGRGPACMPPPVAPFGIEPMQQRLTCV